jgi:Transposase domain (DUF772)
VIKQSGLFGLSDHLKRLSANGDSLEELGRIVDFEGFRVILTNALAYADGARGGRPPYDCVAMFKVLIMAAQNNVSDARMEYLIRDRLSWLRFLGFDLGAPTPDANTIRLFRERLTEAKAITVLFDAFDNRLRTNGIKRAEAKITLVNLTYNMQRLAFTNDEPLLDKCVCSSKSEVETAENAPNVSRSGLSVAPLRQTMPPTQLMEVPSCWGSGQRQGVRSGPKQAKSPDLAIGAFC